MKIYAWHIFRLSVEREQQIQVVPEYEILSTETFQSVQFVRGPSSLRLMALPLGSVVLGGTTILTLHGTQECLLPAFRDTSSAQGVVCRI